MEHLVANTGIQFLVNEIEFNPTESVTLSNGKTLKYVFCDYQNYVTNKNVFDFVVYHQADDKYIPLNELVENNGVECQPNGLECVDEFGLMKIKSGISSVLFTTFVPSSTNLFTINSLNSFRVNDPKDGKVKVPAFDVLLDKWLPMPMFEKNIDGITIDSPFGWCRMKIMEIGEGQKKGDKRYRLIWALDTTLTDNLLSNLRPNFSQGNSKEFCLCNRADELLNFMSIGNGFTAYSDYISSILGIRRDLDNCKFRAYYIYLINVIRLIGASPEIVLYNECAQKDINVDLVLDVGNSRTCGVLFEESDFTKAEMLKLRDLSKPWIVDDKAIDMRLVFRRADFGNDIILEEDLFEWKSFVRVGEEAKRLVYRSIEDEGLKDYATNYSSPKRYLWDNKKHKDKWQNLTTIDDPFSIGLTEQIYIKGLSNQFNGSGEYVGNKKNNTLFQAKEQPYYSRSSLMTFVMIELLQQAISQINSVAFRTHWGNINCRRKLRNVIVTCPTAMPKVEQIRLRQCVLDAYQSLTNINPSINTIKVIPSPEALKEKDDMEATRVWSFDEASCCQLVYLYAEIKQRYDGEIHKFFELKGHVRQEFKTQGYEKKSITIGTIDIGAGTTDVMIAAYKYDGDGQSRVTPVPLYWDSFYLAGDDIVKNIIKNIIIEGPESKKSTMGNITSVLSSRIMAMSDDELRELPCLRKEDRAIVYKKKVEDIIGCVDLKQKEAYKKVLVSDLIHDFFGEDSAMMFFKDRRCRVDFNTMISLPIAQMMLDLLRLHRPSRVYTYNEIFTDSRPASYLLDYFESHFGFRFEELEWRFNPDEVANQVKSTMEPLMKQLSMVFYAHNCDIIVLAGRPSSLDAISELFIKYIPVSPDRLIRLNEYHVGNWYPFADGQGFFYEPKTIVAVGGMVGYLAESKGFNGMALDFSEMTNIMKSTAKYIGKYKERVQQVEFAELSPTKSMSIIESSVFPVFLGCRLLNSPQYQARPLYIINNKSGKNSLRITINRDYQMDREELFVDSVSDKEGNELSKDSIELSPQSIVNDGTYWLDKGVFDLGVNKA